MNENDTNKYEGLKSSLYTCYYICFMPLIVIVLSLIEKLIFGKTSAFTMMSGQFYWLIFLIPIAFLVFDLPEFILKKRKIGNVKSFVKRYPELFIYILFVLWAIIATVLQVAIFGESNAIYNVIIPLRISEGTLMFVYYLMVGLAAFFIKDRKIIRNMLYISGGISLIICLLTLIDPNGEIFCFFEHINSPYSSLFLNCNHFGYYLAIFVTLIATIGLFLDNKKLYVIDCVALAFSLFVMFLNDTFGVHLSIFVAFIIIPFVLRLVKGKLKFKYFVPFIMFVLVSFIAVLPKEALSSKYELFSNQLITFINDIGKVINNSNSHEAEQAGTGRWGLWLMAFKEIAESPIIGTGNVLLRPHNEYLQFGQVWGIPAMILYICVFVIMLVKLVKHRNKISDLTLILFAVVYVYLISALFGNTMPHTYPLFMLMFGFLVCTLNQDKENNKI